LADENQSKQPEIIQKVATVDGLGKAVAREYGEGVHEVREGANASAPKNFVLPEPVKMPPPPQNASDTDKGGNE